MGLTAADALGAMTGRPGNRGFLNRTAQAIQIFEPFGRNEALDKIMDQRPAYYIQSKSVAAAVVVCVSTI
jgi:hypothetical protein